MWLTKYRRNADKILIYILKVENSVISIALFFMQK